MLRIITPTSLIAGVILLWAQSIIAASFPQYSHQYSDQYLLNVPESQDSISTQVYAFGSDSTMRQSFILRTQDPGARQLELNHLFMSIYFWAGSGSSLELNLYEGPVNNSNLPIHSQAFSFQSIDAKTGFVYPEAAKVIALDSGVVLNFNQEYTFEILVHQLSESTYGFYQNHYDYSEGQSDQGAADIWFKLQGTVDTQTDSIISRNAQGQRLVYDTWSEYFPTKMVGLYQTASIIVTPTGGQDWEYLVHQEDIGTVSQYSQGSSDSLVLLGKSEGITPIWIVHQGDTLSYLQMDVRKKKILEVSYSYIEYPGESTHSIKSYMDTVSKTIIKTYDSINVDVRFTDNGILSYEWDFNGDSNSYTADRKEVWSPLDSNVIPDQLNYFSHLFSIRTNKDDSYYGGTNGGGSSRGFGLKDAPPRGAYKKVHLFHEPEHISSTLSHELAHNLGVSHYSIENLMHAPPHDEINIMKTGRDANQFFQFQWNIIHNTIQTLSDQGESYDNRSPSTHTLQDTNFLWGDTLVLDLGSQPRLIIKPLTGPLTQLNDSTLIGQNVGVGWVEVYVPETIQNQGLRDTIQVEVLDSVTSLKDQSSLETSETQVQYDASGQIQAQDRPRQSGILLQTQKGQINLR